MKLLPWFFPQEARLPWFLPQEARHLCYIGYIRDGGRRFIKISSLLDDLGYMFVYCVFSGEAGYYANQDDDFIFEDFARLRLKGHDADDTEA